MTTSVIANPNEFMGYPIDVVRGHRGLGPAMMDAELYAVVQAFEAQNVEIGSGLSYGPALLTTDATQVVRSSTAYEAPVFATKPVVADAKLASWDTYDLDGLIAKAAEKGVVLPRVKTPGKVIAALEGAGVTP